MADYWKSQTRKFCEFCKCWLSDNKPSIQFHESGKRHKAAVEARIKEIGKKSLADHKAKQQMDADIKKMEEAAMKAYSRDLEQNPDLSSLLAEKSTENKMTAATIGSVEEKKTRWHEAKSSEGDVYYWHSVTGESKWEVPAEGFISMKDQSTKTAAAALAVKKEPPKSGKRKSGKADNHKSGCKQKFDKSKKKAKTDASVVTAPSPLIIGPSAASKPYGAWEAVVDNRVTEPIDLQLPTSNHAPLKLSQPIVDDEETTEFAEKSFVTISDGSVDSSNINFKFKKPKVNRNNTRNRNTDL